jgi:Rhs element Vgr protein
MPETRTLPTAAQHREFTVKVAGTPLPREHQLLGAYVMKAVNKIASARLIFLDGNAAQGDFPLSNADLLVPGQPIEILAGATDEPVSIFQGLIIGQGVKVRENTAPQLIVECRHAAVKLTVGRKSAYYADQTDSDMITTLLENASLGADVEATSVTHPHQVQYAATDWDFLLTRAEANGKLVLTNTDQVVVKAPDLGQDPVFSLVFGATILELDTTMDARTQFNAIQGLTWDAAQQSVVTVDGEDPGLNGPGNLSPADLAAAIGLEAYELRDGAIAEAEVQSWTDAQWLKAQLNKVTGRVKCEGIPTVNPGDLVDLSGLGDRYSGPALVTGVRQDYDLVQGWKTHVQVGGIPDWLADSDRQVTAPKAGALLPGVNGLQIGVVVSNEDPDGEYRVQVRMPLVDDQDDGTWARVASLDAGDNRGFFFRPEVGDEVVLGFLNDDPRQAVILGMLHSSAKAAPLEGSDDNPEKLYQSRSQLKLSFNDDTKVILLETPAGNRITLSDDDQGITLADQSGNKIALTPDGIVIESAQAIQLTAGTELTQEAGTSLTASAGTELTVEGTASAGLSSSGMVSVSGAQVQLG